MKDIHPQYFPNTTITCACGAQFSVGSTMREMRVEICSNCHPYFTGSHKFIDTAGRVERFKQKLEKSQARSTKSETKSNV